MKQQGSLCPYSLYSLQVYLLYPSITIGQSINIPHVFCYVLAFCAPAILVKCCVPILAKLNYVTLVNHPHVEQADHPHTSATTISVIFYSSILSTILRIGLAFVNVNSADHLVPLGFYLILLSFFHFSEFFVTSLTNPSTLAPSSFLITNSLGYAVAILTSVAEYLIESYFFPGFKKFNLISLIGLLIATSGDLVRKLAMFTAGRNFSHIISFTKRPDHQLVTHGIYKFMRHPSYAGWFYWAVGTQIMLLNPISTALFTYLSCKFFSERISYEEEILIEFFENYKEYKHRVKLWMPLSLSRSEQTH